MQGSGIMDTTPLWAIFLISCITVVFFWELGFRLGKALDTDGKRENEQSVTTLVGTIVGLLVFLLAFTFNMAAGRFQERRDVLVDEANAIGTTYLRTDTLPEPEGTNLKRILREYVDNRIDTSDSGSLPERISRANDLQKELWAQTVSATQKEDSPVTAIFVTSMNEMIDMHAKRLTMVFQHHIPDLIWFALFGLTALGIAAMGYQNGLLDHAHSPTVVVVTLMFAIVIFLIADLDRPGKGLINVDQQPMIDLRNSMDQN
jgi:hypothetical protein